MGQTATGSKLLSGKFTTPFSIKRFNSTSVPRPVGEIEEKPFSLDDVIKYLDAFCTSISNDGEKVDLLFALSNAKKISNKDYIVELIAKSSMDEQTLLKYKYELAQSLKNKLSYKVLKLEIRAETQEKQTVLYNRMDKYFAMVKQNPQIEALKNAFDADIQL